MTGNNLTYLPDTFSKLYVYSKELVIIFVRLVYDIIYYFNFRYSNKKVVSEKFASLEELYLDQNKLREEDSFDVLAVLKK